MQLSVLTPMEDGSFRPQKIEIDSKLNVKKMLSDPNKFFLCTKSCNGAYYPVASELPNILTEQKKHPNGMARAVLKRLNIDEDVHGQRFIVFSNGGEAYLLGDVTSASKKLSQ